MIDDAQCPTLPNPVHGAAFDAFDGAALGEAFNHSTAFDDTQHTAFDAVFFCLHSTSAPSLYTARYSVM